MYARVKLHAHEPVEPNHMQMNELIYGLWVGCVQVAHLHQQEAAAA